MIKIILLSLMFSQAPQDTFNSNILKVCEMDTVSANRKQNNNLKNCFFYDLEAQFIFSDSVITIVYDDSTKTKSTMIVDEHSSGFDVSTYNCHYAGINSLLLYYNNINLVKLYFYNPDDKKTYVQFYLNTRNN